MGLPVSTDLILVGVMPNPHDLDIARLLGWYRIPLRSAPKLIDVDHLAFYQTGAFGEEQRWRIQFAAAMRGHELVRRVDLFRDQPDHPHAHEEYYKITLGPLESLPHPVLAGGWKRLTFLYTTGARLLSATTLNDLVIRDEERTILWRTLRERAVSGGRYAGQPEFSLSLEQQLQFFTGIIKETGTEWLVDSFD
ncbi:MAG: hypothetical protein HPY85_13740 [Anaerolineae bacterium]|nr:hypothetical protein [Anaerolineae bacterium]